MTTRSAAVGDWQAYLTNRSRRQRDGRFLIHGHELLTAAIAHGWPIERLVYRLGGLSSWARETLDSSGLPSVGLVPEVMADLAEPGYGVPDLVAVAHTRQYTLAGFVPDAAEPPVLVVVERPTGAAQLGAILRSAQAFGAAAVVVSGSGADLYDPQCVRASAGALFALPVFRVSGAGAVTAYRAERAAAGQAMALVGVAAAHPDPHANGAGPREIAAYDFNAATVLVVGDELGETWHRICDDVVHLPVVAGLPTPCALSVALYEIARRRQG
ncbi:TrmH family RNA methyltransferase [Nocardia stercoris]|uniref:TrmH family RNA methyltransferase n=1 Tax=Nocardia stercoris TaxID=2483361 RepID=UPI001F2FCA0F|nr:TrmH family RNA methyltransferase [Nocardia stercoris]